MTTSVPEQPRDRRVLSACCSAHAVQDGLVSSIYVLLPLLAQSLALGLAQVGLVRAVHAAAMWLLEIPSGIAAERVGERRLLVFGLLSAGAGYLSLSVAEGFHGVLLALLVAGCGAAFQHALSSALVSRSAGPSERRRALGAYNSSGDVGKLIFTGVFSVAVGAGIHWQGIAAGYGLAAIVAAGVVGALLAAAGAGAAPHRTRPDGGGRPAAAGWGIRHRGGFAALAAIVFLDIAVQDGFLVYVTFLMLGKGLPTGLAVGAVTLTLVGGVAGKLLCGMLADRFGTVRTLVVVEVLTALGIVTVLLAPPAAALLTLPLLGVVLQGSSTITYGAVSDFVHRERQSRGFALAYTMSSSASMVGPLAFGLASERLGLDAALCAMAAIVLLPLPLTVALRRGLDVARSGRAA